MTISPAMQDVFQRLVRVRPGNPFPGKVAAIWAKMQGEIEALVRAEKLKEIYLLPEKAGPAPAAAEESALFWWRPDGGWPLPHFHLGDKIYPATDKQWKTFSGQALSKAGASLQQARAQAKVSFDDFMQITEVTAKL